MRVVIWHNPRCRKSREALAYLREKGVEPEIYEYLKEPPSPERLREVLALLGARVGDVLRRQEKEYRELVRGRDLSEDELLRLVSAHPRLLERPIVVVDDAKAVLARPKERIDEIL